MKKFGGFTQGQMQVIAKSMGFDGPMHKFNEFLAASPGKAATLSRLTTKAREVVEKGGAGYADGGAVPTWGNETTQTPTTTAPETTTTTETQAPLTYSPEMWATFDQSQKHSYIDDTTAKYGGTTARLDDKTTDDREAYRQETGKWPVEDPVAYEAWLKAKYPTATSGTGTSGTTEGMPLNNGELVAPEVETIQPTEEQQIAEGTGQAAPIAPVEAQTVDEIAQAEAPVQQPAATYEASTIDEQVKQALANFVGATGSVSEQSTVQGQLAALMSDFEGGQTPAWAAGAIRTANAAMAARGLSASSMAGQAIIQATMEAALPIAMQDANTFAQMDFANLNNTQQALMFKTQARVNGLLSDQAAQNAAKQFNASSENQVNQFYAGLTAQITQFNAAQTNGIRQYNTSAVNAMTQFNTQLQSQRDQFNAQNELIVAQANAQWMQQITTINNAEQNEANRIYAQQLNDLTASSYNHIWQTERDLMAYLYTSAENAKDREHELIAQKMNINGERSNALWETAGTFAGKLLGNWMGL